MASNAVSDPNIESPWKILLVDDEPLVHQATQLALRRFAFEGRSLEIFSAYSGKEAIEMMNAHPDTAIILLDVVMETPDAGLKVAHHIRQTLENKAVRIVLRTGQPGQVPEESVILEYDINDYKTKLELTQPKLVSTFIASLRAYRDIIALQNSRAQLTEANQALQSMNQTLELRVQQRTQALSTSNEKLRHEINERLKVEAAQRTYLHALTHDLRNPVTGLANVLKSFLNRHQTSGSQALDVSIPVSVLQRMTTGCDRLLRLIDSLLETHSFEIWGVSLQCHPFDFELLIADILADWEPKLERKRIQVSVELAPNLALIDGDRSQIARVLDNLISNAVKYNPPDIAITITAHPSTQHPNELRCTVQDNGIGIAEAQLKNIFSLYQRGNETRPLQGLGLGLYICRHIMEAHQGEIGVQSCPGEGTEFWLRLPYQQQASPAPNT